MEYALEITLGDRTISMTLTYWIDDGLMALFFPNGWS